jgi:hypothetical protein
MTATALIHFGPSYSGLTTFPSSNTFDLYTELDNATWTVTKTETSEDRPAEVTTMVKNKKSIRARISGWDLSYGRRSFDLSVELTGTAPDVPVTQSKTILRIQELDPSANPVEGTTITKKYTIRVPEPETPSPTVTTPQPAPVETTETTATPPPVTTPTVKKTYSPGPEPVMVIGLLGIVVVLLAFGKRSQ